MSKGARSAAGLAGFVLVAGAQPVFVLLILWTVLRILPSGVALRLGVPLSIATFGALGYATWRALHTRRRQPAGVVVTRDRAPELWKLVDGAAAAAGVTPPDGLTVVADATVTVGERTRLLGLIGGRRDLYLGLPLLQAFDPARLRAAVTHELAHASPVLSRWAPLARRGRVAVARVAPRISRRHLLLRAYAGLYRRIDTGFSREQEFAADRIAAGHAGVEAMTAVLRDLPVLAGMQRLFHAEYVGPGWQAGFVPDDVFGGFLRVLAARSAEMEVLRGQELPPSGEWDTHPPAGERVAALTALPPAAAPSSPSAAEPAAPSSAAAASAPEDSAAEPELVPDLPLLGRALQDVAYPAAGRTVVTWDECLSVARTAEMEREAEATLATLSRATGTEVTGPAQVLDLAAGDRLRPVAATLFPEATPEQTTERIVDLLGLMLALAALRSGVVRWRHSWTGAAEVVGVDGAYLNLAELAAAAADPGTVEAVREYLMKIGVDLGAPAGDGAARILGGLVNLVADGARTDLLITDLGLLLVPGLPRGRGGESKRRLAGTAARPRAGSDGRFVPFADVTAVTTLPGRRKGWVIALRDGGEISLRPGLDSDELPGGWQAWDETVGFLTETRTGVTPVSPPASDEGGAEPAAVNTRSDD
ncbi:M48 family metallopeptidase [Actinoplanes sp. DH11]|uniref:M48 family metallopeptidase n=1 Tax=Actinoplanes sp. DH11 TaxID=2857011 RepID=UPI001E60E7E0|nr:M48 family metallopeptidase [Actinoplanes sp. DH11]